MAGPTSAERTSFSLDVLGRYVCTEISRPQSRALPEIAVGRHEGRTEEPLELHHTQ